MLLTFSKQKFVDRIKDGTKIHIVRSDEHNRWHPGMLIHFWHQNPRNVSKHPKQFGVGIVKEVIKITIDPINNRLKFYAKDQHGYVTIYTPAFLDWFARNDGFDSWEDLKKWFTEPFTGKCIYWHHCNFNQ